MATEELLTIRTADPEDDQLLKELLADLGDAGLDARGGHEALRDGKGKAQSTVFILALLATPAVVKLAGKIGDAIVEWVKRRKPRTELVIECAGRKVTIQTTELANASASAIADQIRLVLSAPAEQPAEGPQACVADDGGSHGGGDGGGRP